MIHDRRDSALILARGESSRMGRPKGLCVADDDPRPLLARVADIHLSANHPVTVVTVAALADRYGEALGGRCVDWLILEPGGGTARSVLAAVHSMPERVTHLWLHPVDLPRVAEATLRLLGRRSRREPEAIIVPEYEGVPGHPVLLPQRPAGMPWPVEAAGSMRELLSLGSWPVIVVPCSDPGISDDLDTPEDLTQGWRR